MFARTSPPRLIATDLDGTFLGPRSTVSPTNLRALQAAREAGVPVVFATGRPPTWMGPIEDLGLDHAPVIGGNGAIRYDLVTGEIQEMLTIDTDAIARLGSGLAEVAHGASLGLQWADGFGYEADYFAEDAPDLPGYFTGELEELLSHGAPMKVLIQSWSHALDDLVQAVTELVGEDMTVTWSTPGQDVGERILLELGAPGVDKASMLSRHCAELGIEASEVAAFGDMPNDRSMLQWAGQGYVIAPVHAELLDVADHILHGDPSTAVGRTMLGWFGTE